MTILEFLQRSLDPKYVGWKDQYKAILNALGIDPNKPYYEVLRVLEELK